MVHSKKILLAILGATTIILSGCSSTKNQAFDTAAEAKAINLSNEQLLQDIKKSGATVVAQGDQIEFILPVNKFFADNSDQVKLKQQTTFHNISTVIHRKGPTTKVKVTGFTNNFGSISAQNKRAQQHAEVVAAYLWNQGIDNSQISINNAGSHNAVAYNDTMAGNQANRRVEIMINQPAAS